ncbi:glycosyltransferase [Undibacterium sp. LX40W]|uniref:Glycosyltransferase n=1 Tax=Undibacterium nitidum TaxID=2762298 RepID=A0A923HPV3_9BURK|nr:MULTISPECIES: glycosyltransferase family 4 protein [Undibacterium]MBC3881723.1 glycosyltransferase [Undibacterium nitidum]MBC3892280.1 glycosyltransferase [Undibacterium sp. LX40W]
MTKTIASQLYLIDALNQVISDPGSRFHWRTLLNRLLSCHDSELHQHAYERIEAEVASEGMGGFHRAIFLAHVFSVDRAIEEAARILADLRPVHVDRIMAFINSEWATRLTKGSDTISLEQHFKNTKIESLLQLVAQQIKISHLNTRNRRNEIKRVAIYLPQINDSNHPPTSLALQHVKVMQEKGLEVKVFSAQELQIQQSREYLSNDAHVHNAAFDEGLLEEMKFFKPIEVVKATEDFSLALRYQDIANQISQYEPDILFFVGNHSPLLAALYEHMPILTLNVNSHAPLGNYDIWLSAKKAEELHSDIDRSRSAYYPFRVFRQATARDMSYFASEKRNNELTLITVGARLPDEIKSDWVERIRPLFDEFPKLKWKLIGGKGELPQALKGLDANRIEIIKHSEDIFTQLDTADIYINPPRVGGGFSVAEAMSVGVPCLAYCNTDGGSKLLEYAVRDSNHFVTELRNLINSSEYRQKWSIAMIEIFDKTINLENAGESWMEAAHAALSRYAIRCAEQH